MKPLLLFLLLLFASAAYSQQDKPEIKFAKAAPSINPYVSMLGVADDKAVIVKLTAENSWITVPTVQFLVFEKNKITKFSLTQNLGFKGKEITDISKKKELFNAIERLNTITESQLNIARRENGEQMEVQDGMRYTIEVVMKDLELSVTTYAPEEFIAAQYPGHEERQKFLEIFKTLVNRS